MEERKITLKGAANMRTLAGLPGTDGKVIGQQTLVRSDALYRLKPTDVSMLIREQELHTVVDLRTEAERAQKPDVAIPGVTYCHIPLFTEQTLGVTREQATDYKAMLAHLPEMQQLYRTIVTDSACVERLRQIFDVILTPRKGAVLWHCTAGKDRCGIVSALVLSLLGTPRDVIFRDYLLTNHAAIKDAKKFSALVMLLTRDRAKAAAVKNVFLADRSYLQTAFDAIDETYGSMDVFFAAALGIDEERKRAFQSRILTAWSSL